MNYVTQCNTRTNSAGECLEAKSEALLSSFEVNSEDIVECMMFRNSVVNSKVVQNRNRKLNEEKILPRKKSTQRKPKCFNGR